MVRVAEERGIGAHHDHILEVRVLAEDGADADDAVLEGGIRDEAHLSRFFPWVEMTGPFRNDLLIRQMTMGPRHQPASATDPSGHQPGAGNPQSAQQSSF